MTKPADRRDSITTTVVIPAFRAAATIGAQLTALAAQDFTGTWEVVVVDDGSADGTAEVAAGYQDLLPSLTIIRSPRNRGVNHARNAGAAHSTAEYLLFCDADDIATESWISALVAALQNGDGAGGSLDVHSVNPPRLISEYEPRVGQALQPPSDQLLPSPYGGCCGVRRQIWEKLGGFDERIRWGGGDDTDFFWRLQLAGYRLVAAPEAVMGRRLRAGTLTTMRQNSHYAYGLAQLVRAYRDDLPQTGPSARQRPRFRRRNAATLAAEIGWMTGWALGRLRPDRGWTPLPLP